VKLQNIYKHSKDIQNENFSEMGQLGMPVTQKMQDSKSTGNLAEALSQANKVMGMIHLCSPWAYFDNTTST